MRPWRLLGIAAAGAFLCSLAQAQGLGEAAAKEKQRREQEQKKHGPAKVITTEELDKSASSTASPSSGGLAQNAQRPQDTSSGERSKAVKEGTDEVIEPPGEAQWRQRANDAKRELKEAEAQVKTLEEKASQLFGKIQASTDTNELLRLRAAQQALTKETDEAKAVLEACRRESRELEEEARKAGVPPGWVR